MDWSTLLAQGRWINKGIFITLGMIEQKQKLVLSVPFCSCWCVYPPLLESPAERIPN